MYFIESVISNKVPDSIRERNLVDIKSISPFSKYPLPVKITYMNVISFFISLPLTIYYGLTKNWICNNIFGVAFSVSGI